MVLFDMISFGATWVSYLRVQFAMILIGAFCVSYLRVPGLYLLTCYLKMELAACVFEVFRISSGFQVPVRERERERERDYLKVIYLSRRYLCQII